MPSRSKVEALRSFASKVRYASHKFYLRRRWGCWGVWVEWVLWGSASIIKLQCKAKRRIATTRTNVRPHPQNTQNTQVPHSVAVAWHKRNRHKHTGLHSLISQEKAADTTLGKNPDDGLYLRYCSLSGLFVSGSRCLPYREKLITPRGYVGKPHPLSTPRFSPLVVAYPLCKLHQTS